MTNAVNTAESASLHNAAGEDFQTTMLKIGGGLIIASIVIGFFQIPSPWGTLSLSPADLMLGLLGSLPMFLVTYSSHNLNEFVATRIVPRLALLSKQHLLGIAALLAIGEELFFRGLVPSLLRGLGPMWALVTANAIYATCYAVNKGAWLTMFLFGCYLSALMSSGDTTNIIRPILAHLILNLVLFSALAKAGRPAPVVATSETESELTS